ncbi:MAG TPA: baseplate J/gp47 family protein, partial [Nitrososphaera sp.]|nr:baseplate J/gp47 family protein [Nitrososphaera sp.]
MAEWAYSAKDILANNDGRVLAGELEVLSLLDSPEKVLVIRPTGRGDFSTYGLSLVKSADTPSPPTGFDVILSHVDFSFKVECPSEFDCACVEELAQESLPEPAAIDYMAKDYASFRKLVLDRLSLIMPDWKDRNPADIGIMLVELLAYVGDHLSYYQDATATEAYLGTARSRISAARHARLLDYRVHDGKNARAWVCFSVNTAELVLPKGTQLLTKTENDNGSIVKQDVRAEVIKGAEVFESMYDAKLYQSKNRLSFYTWSETDCWLPAGSTSATINGSGVATVEVFVWQNVPGDDSAKLTDYLANNFGFDWLERAAIVNSGTVITMSSGSEELTMTLQEDKAILAANGKQLYAFEVKEDQNHKYHVQSSCLRVGDILVFAEEMSIPPSCSNDKVEEIPNISHRHAVRVTSVAAGKDELTGTDVLEIEWDGKDSLPFSMCLEKEGKPMSVIYGNVVLADHGFTKSEDLASKSLIDRKNRRFKETVVAGKYYPWLDDKPLTMRGPDFETTAGKGGPASSAFDYGTGKAIAAVSFLDTNSLSWKPAHDLFSIDEFARSFVVETERDTTSYFRFSEQNRIEWGEQITEDHECKRHTFKGFSSITYRIGNGSKGNVGAESITKIAAGPAAAGIYEIINPMPARGGEDPESIDSIRLHAPQAFRKQERAVTAPDYETILKRYHNGVQRAAAEKRWTGSWYTMYVAIDRKGGLDVDSKFENEIVELLEKYRMAGLDVEIQQPLYVPLKLSIEVCLKDGYFKGEVLEALLKAFSSKPADSGFFNPDNFTFGQTLYLSRI